jgi:uncharacterized protein (DUF4415 family)
MKTEYDFTKSKKNPYIKKLKKQITIRLDADIIDYFKKISDDTGIPYQNLINLYLMDCANKQKKPDFAWK